jgi:hypothetical protein
VKESKKGSKTEMWGEKLSLAKELKVVNEPNMTYSVGGRQCTDYIKVKKKSVSQNSHVKNCLQFYFTSMDRPDGNSKLMEFGDI